MTGLIRTRNHNSPTRIIALGGGKGGAGRSTLTMELAKALSRADVVLYDELAGRWMMSEFSNSGNRLCVYVSQTGDPVAGGWFNYDFQASASEAEFESGEVMYNFRKTQPFSQDMPGASCFAKRDGKIYHTYSVYSRGLDRLNGVYNYLDIAPKGRDEDGLPFKMGWVKRHDEY